MFTPKSKKFQIIKSEEPKPKKNSSKTSEKTSEKTEKTSEKTQKRNSLKDSLLVELDEDHSSNQPIPSKPKKISSKAHHKLTSHTPTPSSVPSFPVISTSTIPSITPSSSSITKSKDPNSTTSSNNSKSLNSKKSHRRASVQKSTSKITTKRNNEDNIIIKKESKKIGSVSNATKRRHKINERSISSPKVLPKPVLNLDNLKNNIVNDDFMNNNSNDEKLIFKKRRAKPIDEKITNAPLVKRNIKRPTMITKPIYRNNSESSYSSEEIVLPSRGNKLNLRRNSISDQSDKKKSYSNSYSSTNESESYGDSYSESYSDSYSESESDIYIPMECPMCHKSLDRLSESERQIHANTCIDETPSQPDIVPQPKPVKSLKNSEINLPDPNPSSSQNCLAVLCPYPNCGIYFEYNDFYVHAQKKHKRDIQTFSCPICLMEEVDYVPNTSTNLLGHLKRAHKDLIPNKMNTQPIVQAPTLLVEKKDTVDFITFKITEKTIPVKTECSLCLEDFIIGQEATRLECLCLFHNLCINEWIKKKSKICCPLHNRESL